MDSNKTLDILKMAILMEKRGLAFYSNVAAQSNNPEISNIFKTMADRRIHSCEISFGTISEFRERNKEFTCPNLPDQASRWNRQYDTFR
jgi:hypothetical protein